MPSPTTFFPNKSLPTEINLHILSFLSDRELASSARVCQSAHEMTNTVLRERMKAFAIGRERFKALCLANPTLAKFGIDIDAVRSRYLLLKNDICEIALLSEEVARHIFSNVRLKKSDRLDRHFSYQICKHFPQLAVELFSEKELSTPTEEQMVELITENPALFDVLFDQPKFIHLINHSKTLIDIAMIKESIALTICNHCDKFNKLDKTWFVGVGRWFEKVAIAILQDPAFESVLYDDDLLKLGKTYVEAAKLIIENRKFTSKLHDEQLAILQDKVTEDIMLMTMQP